MKFFRYDSAFWNVTGKLFDLFLLNILWVLTSLPLVTIGASSAALYSVTMQMARKEEPAILRSYFAAFKKGWKTATLVWLLSLIVACWLAFGVYVCSNLQNAFLRLAVIPEAALLILCLLGMVYLFPVCAAYPGGVTKTLKTACYLSLLRLPWTCLLVLIATVPVLLTLFVPKAFPLMLMLWLFLGAGGISFAQSLLLKRLLLQQPSV